MSSPSLSAAEVLRIAQLARLELTPEEVELFARQLANILQYVEQIRELDTSGVPPTSHVMNQPVERVDERVPSLTREEALENAPEAATEAGLFKVPRVFG
ncbi:MAG TPA: Asp-tRNA(Asn)/Glu-tRNA(Gln) amidotransferase subunit GatC [Vicinamibacterales bacterium]|nr:Asp-tRNA(Asn)/Glu-tRNA(Gln) amidotransferase subunit GatC [Vicinamibacterales bacterium]